MSSTVLHSDLTKPQRRGIELAHVQMPLVGGSLEVLGFVVEGLLPIYGTDECEPARKAATSYIVGAALFLQFGADAADQLAGIFSVFDSADFDTQAAVIGYGDQREMMQTPRSIQ